ncbi:ead/Ea22-like family protein [Enterobacter hormaechei]|uniref:ead/Ea22-like family protein n=1 Tax=Enterobacter hormaechei TaxID=158836 RepID=UPI003AED3A02
MSNIDKQSLRNIAAAAESAPLWHAVGVFGEVVDPANPEWKPVHDFCKTFTAERVLALLDELKAAEERSREMAELLINLKKARPGGVYFNKWDTQIDSVLRTAGINVAAAGKGEAS